MMIRGAGEELRWESLFLVDEALLVVIVHERYRYILTAVSIC